MRTPLREDMNPNLPQIVLFGDSLTQWGFEEENRGFGWVLQQKYAGKAEIINEGQAGYTTTMLKEDFEKLIKRATANHAPPTLLITIFLGANDAAFMPWGEYVPLDIFEENIRYFIDSILIEDNLATTKIVLITPPPTNSKSPVKLWSREEEERKKSEDATGVVKPDDAKKQGPRYKSYMNKKRYAEQIMTIAEDYAHTGLVVGFNLWKALIDAALVEQGRAGDPDRYEVDRLPGSGLSWAKEFGQGWFTDGLHFGALAYDVLEKGLMEVVLTKWPELAPEELGKGEPVEAKTKEEP